jgi:membrane-anchored protein YejM (alkaline phosphatase superfamily)
VFSNSPRKILLVTLIAVFWANFYMGIVEGMGLADWLFLLLASGAHAFILSSPVVVCYFLSRVFSRNPAATPYLVALTFLSSLAVILFLLVNYKLREMYGFYVNFFVVNLMTTPGGIEAMGVSDSTFVSMAVAIALLAGVWYALIRFVPLQHLLKRRVGAGYMIGLFCVLFVIQAGWYAWSEYSYQRTMLQVADRLVWYNTVTARNFFEDLGFAIERPEGVDVDLSANGTIDYPATPEVEFTKPYNIVWLVAESLRSDMLRSDYMPQTWEFSKKAQKFDQHYSGGNGTRMGMFSQFYGLYGNYWFDFLFDLRPPMMMELVKNNGYDLMAYTSSRFSYPEFDHTIFAQFEEGQLQSYIEGEGWERDRKNVTDMIDFVDKAKSPFFSFMFFESAHANYYFPEESVIAPDYLEDFNYITVDVEKDIELIRNRYINAVHHLDSQIGRVLHALEEQGRLEDTVVIVTGDHGEEFMENGRWGHNSTFSQEQIRVPMLVYAPDLGTGVHSEITSHLDMPATVLSLLGYHADPSLYSFGQDLFSANYNRGYTVVSDWHGNALLTPDVKMVFSKKSGSFADEMTNIDDDRIDIDTAGNSYQADLNRFAQEISRFYF